jgi:hypothetical protein
MATAGAVKTTGVVSPLTAEWYIPMLNALEEEGIRMVETVRNLDE